MFHPLASLKEVETVDLIIGTTFSDKPSNFTRWGELFNLTNKVSSTNFPCGPLIDYKKPSSTLKKKITAQFCSHWWLRFGSTLLIFTLWCCPGFPFVNNNWKKE